MGKEGYGLCDSMYYVKDEGEGLQGLDLVDSQVKVDEMIRKYDSSKKLVLTVMRDKRKQAVVVSPMKSKKSVKFIAKSYPSFIDLEAGEDQSIPYQVQTQDSVCYQPLHTNDQPSAHQFSTQNSVICENVQTQIDENPFPEEEDDGEASDDSYSWWDEGQYDPVYAEEKRRKEEEELKATIAEMKRKREDPMLHYEGETDVEDIFVNDDECFEQIPPEQPVKKKVKRPGPTLRSHSQVVIPDIPDWAPSDDEEEVGFMKEEDDDGFEPLSFVLPKGRKSRAKKQKKGSGMMRTEKAQSNNLCSNFVLEMFISSERHSLDCTLYK